MKYDIFLVHAREDAVFAKSVAQSLQRYNLSVLYQDSLTGQESIRDVIENERQVSDWSPKMADCLAIQSPPESPDSIARKFQMKLAGTPLLQQSTLSGNHPQIQYVPPRISTFRDPRGAKLHQETLEAQMKESIASDLERADSSVMGDIDDNLLAENAEDEDIGRCKSISDEPIGHCFSLETRQQIGKRLDVYLRDLSNWKNLAKKFKITDEKTLKSLLASGTPTMHLLDMLAYKSITLGEFKSACKSIDRNDICEYIDSKMYNAERLA